MFSSAASKAEAEPSSSRRSSTGPSALPNAHSQYNAAVAATAAAVTPSLRAPPAPAPPREKFADLKWMWSRTIQSPSGTPLTREQIERKVLAGPRVLAAIERITSDAHSGVAGGPAAGNTMSREEASKAAKANFAGMYADVSQTVIRSSIYVMRKVWRTMYEGIRVNEEGIERLHEYAHAKVPVVLMPMHKSHIDYLLLTYVCAAYNLFPPHIIAGNNLDMPLVGGIMRHGGGLFIRRVFGNDELYRAVFFEYMALLLSTGHSLEVFIEGGRSRSGKVRRPKIGVMQVLVDMLATGRLGDRDIMLVPIAISYDKIIEGATYVNEILGARKTKESLTATLNSVNHVVRLNFGSIDVSICPAISMRDALGLHISASSLPRESSLYHQCSAVEKQRMVRSLAHRVCFEMNRRLVISATSVIATVLLTNMNRGIARKDIITRAEALKRMIVERGGQVAHIFSVEPMSAVVDRALRVLSKLISEQHSIVFGFRNMTSLELSFYRNQLLHIFISESLMAIAMAAEYKDTRLLSSKSAATTRVQKSKLIDSVRFVSQLTKFEFIFTPAMDLETNVEDTIEALVARGVLQPAPLTVSADGMPPTRASAASCTELLLNPGGVDTFLFLCMLAWPFLETYWVAVASLMILLPDVIMEDKKLAEIASRRAEAEFYSGHVEFYEALNTESIMNAFEWCISQGILRVHQVGSTRMLQLTPDYQAPADDLHAGHTHSGTTEGIAAAAPPAYHPPANAPVTKRATSLDRSAPAPGPRPSLLRLLVLRVGRFRKVRLMSSEQNRSLMENFVAVSKQRHSAPAAPAPPRPPRRAPQLHAQHTRTERGSGIHSVRSVAHSAASVCGLARVTAGWLECRSCAPRTAASAARRPPRRGPRQQPQRRRRWACSPASKPGCDGINTHSVSAPFLTHEAQIAIERHFSGARLAGTSRRRER